MVDLKNFELEAITGAAIPSATVQAYIASDTHPNPGAVVATTSTDPNGNWELTGLASGTYDIKVTTGGRIKWYKGNTKHNILHLYDDTTPDPNRNLCPNGSLDTWNVAGLGSIVLPTANPGVENFADGWTAYLGSGDSGTVQADATIRATNSKYSAKFTYTRSGGQCTAYRDLPDPIWQQMKGQQIAVSIWVDQITTSSVLAAFIDDGIDTTVGTVTNTVNSGVIVWATRAISASATRVRVGIVTARANTGSQVFYIDNCMVDFTSAQPVYAAEMLDSAVSTAYTTVSDAAAPAVDGMTVGNALSFLANRVKAITGLAGWKTVLSDTLATLRTAVNAAQTTANTGVSNAATAQSTANTGVTNAAAAQLSANNAQTAASNAQTSANNAQTSANSAQTTANARTQIFLGAYSGNSSIQTVSGIGFTPRVIVVVDITTNSFMAVLANGIALCMTAGSATNAQGVTLSSGSFQMGGSGGLNTTGHNYGFTAFG